MSDYTEAANYMLLAAESNDSWMKDRALRRVADELTRLQSEVERLRGRCGELDEQKHKLKWKLAYQAMHHVRLHNRWVCGELDAPEEESIVNPFMYAETEIWWAIGDEADGFAKQLEE